MKKIEIDGSVGEVVEIVYKDAKIAVKLGERDFAVDFTDAVVDAMKKDANAFLNAAQLVYRGDYSGVSHAKARIAAVVSKSFDAIKVVEKKPVEKPATKAETPKVEKKTEPDPKVEEPKEEPKPVTTDDKVATPTTTEKKPATAAPATTKKTTSSTAKKSTTTSTTKKK